MSTVRVYKSTDPGAPPHPSEVRGSMAALLRACLVTGYGSGDFTAEPAGWEEPYPETNNYACFRALSGVRQFYRINDNQTDPDVTVMTMCDSMSDAEVAIGINGSVYFGKQNADSYPGTCWYVIADERTCYVFLHNYYALTPHGFGEFYSYRQQDLQKGFLAGHNYYASMLSNSIALLSSATNPIKVVHTLAGSSGDAYVSISMNSGASTYSLNGTYYCRSLQPGEMYTVMPAYLQDLTTSVDGTNTGCMHRGFLRGLRYPVTFLPKPVQGETFEFDGKTFISFICSGSDNTNKQKGQIWVDISGSWEESV